MWNLPGPGIKLVSPTLASGFFTTGPPGKPYTVIFQCIALLLTLNTISVGIVSVSIFCLHLIQRHSVSSVTQSCLNLCDPWTAALQASLSITNSWSFLKFTSIMSVMPSNHLILCRPLLLQPSIFPSIRIFSNESVLCIRWPKYWSFSFSISPSHV